MKARRVLLALTMVWAIVSVLPAQRLSQTVTPEHYDLHFVPDFSTDAFDGTASITVRLLQPSSSITLNAAELELLDTTIAAGGMTQPATVSLDRASERATLTVPRPMPAGRAVIAIRYKGRLNDQLRGFYLSRANDREYAVTQLEATDARRAFPSFDEPAMKATFAVSATIDTRDTAISNGRVMADVPGPGPGKHTMKFSTSRRMSSYLLALLVGDWECVQGEADRIPIRVCGIPGRNRQLGFALESAEFAIRYFNRYFTIKYPFEKLDIVAVPDFSAGAMENVGAIVFREQFLLVDPQAGSTEQRKQVSQFVSHEIAHQWFGDLVTMQWWNDIWLNEGFATWMERRPMQEWKPEWNGQLDEVRDTQGAMALDTMRTTRPIRMHVETPEEINEVFDAIAYQKTAAVVRMMEAYVGPENYRNAVNAYLKKFAYGNATGEGFWNTLASATGKPIDRIMSSYVTQGGIPLVSVSTTCSGGTTELSLSQRPVANGGSTRWEIPVCYKRNRNGKVEDVACTVLAAPTQTVKLDGCSSWVFANAEGRGYYRTSYPDGGLKSLAAALNDNHLSAIEQTSLLEDVWTQVRLNQENIASFLSLARDIVAAPHLSPALLAVTDRLNFIGDRLVEPELQPAFRAWIRQTLGPLAARLAWDAGPRDTDETRRIRSTVLNTLGYAGRDPETLREARRRVNEHLDGTRTLDPSLVVNALQLAALEGDAKLYDRYLTQSREGTTAVQKVGYLSSLAYFLDPALRQRTMDYATSAEVRAQDAPTILRVLMALPASAPDTWAYIKKNWGAIEGSLDVFQGLPAVVRSTEHFCEAVARDDVERFFRENRVRGSERTARQAIETIDRCIATRTGQSGNLASFLTRPPTAN